MGATSVSSLTFLSGIPLITRVAQIKNAKPLPSPEECEGKPLQEVVKLVASRLLGDSYELKEVPADLKREPGFEVYDTLTAVRVLPFHIVSQLVDPLV